MIAVYLQLINTPEAKSEFEKMYYQYRKLMYYIAFDIVQDSSLAEDVVSETFMNLARNFEFIQTLGDIFCPQIKRYIVISVKHTAFNIVKKERRHETLSLDDVEIEHSAGDVGTLDVIIENESVEKLKSVIDSLSEIYKEVMQLYIVCECNVDEVARALDISKDTVYKRIQRARKMIEKAMKEE